MSKIGKKNIIVPKDSSIKIEGANLTISGPKGTKKLIRPKNKRLNNKLIVCNPTFIVWDYLLLLVVKLANKWKIERQIQMWRML